MSMYERSENKHSYFKKFLSVFLVLALCITSFPIAAIAQENDEMTGIEEETQPYVLQELEEYRTIDTKQFLMSDHTVQAVMYNEPVHYEENGDWEDIDNSLEFEESADEEDFDGYKTKEGNFNVKFAEKSDSDKLVTISENDYELSWTLLNKSKARLFADDIDIDETALNNDSTIIEESVENVSQTVTYNNILNDTDIEYTVNGKGLKENIIINEPTDDYTYSFDITANNLILTLQKDSSIIAADSETEESIYVIPTMFMYDANNEVSQDISVSLEQGEENKYILTINANCDWINDENREFPITIDPQVKSKQVESAIYTSCISSLLTLENLADDNNFMVGGYDLKYGLTRILIAFELPELKSNDMIVNSRLNLYEVGVSSNSKTETQIDAHLIKTGWASGIPWAFQPLYNDVVLDYEFIKGSDENLINNGSAVLKSWDITTAVKYWYDGEKSNNGIMLKSSGFNGIFAKFALDSGKNTNAYPFLTITYKNNKGLENYWTYTSLSAGDSDTVYVNDYSGNVVAVHTDVQTSGSRMPVTIEHIRNSCNSDKMYTNIYPSTGWGWKLNIQQTIRLSKDYGLSAESQKIYPYVYEDGDGTEHYFYKKIENGVAKYYDEDGLGLELKASPSGYQIIDKAKNITQFNAAGNIIGFKNNQKTASEVKITYSNFNFDGKSVPVITQVTDGSGHIIKFNSEAITDDYGEKYLLLQSIIDEKGNTISINYDYYHSISSINSPLTGRTTFRLESAKCGCNPEYIENDKSNQNITLENKKLLFGHRLQKISSNRETLTYDRRYHNATAIKSSLSNYTTYIQFDNAGRTISTYTNKSKWFLNRASKNTYKSAYVDSTGSNIKQINALTSTTNISSSTENLLKNHSAEFDWSWNSSAVGDCTFTNAFGSITYSGSRAFKITSTASNNDGRARVYQDLYSDIIIPGNTYTFSAYVRTYTLKQASSKYDFGALLTVTTNNGNVQSYTSNSLTTLNPDSINGGWQRLSVTFTVPKGTTHTRVNMVLKNVIGTAYFDCLQLEEGSAPTDVNLLENGSMRFIHDDGLSPYKWVDNENIHKDEEEDYGYSDGTESYMHIDGDATKNKHIYQDVPITAKETDTYTVSGWAKANASCSNESSRGFDICIRVKYSDNSVLWKVANAAKFNIAVDDWQYTMSTFDLSDGTSANKTPVEIRVAPRYMNQVNSVDFTNFQLVKNNGYTYGYDTNGNLTSSTSGYSSSTQNTYSGNNLTKSTDCYGNVSSYFYDTYDNLTKAVSQRVVCDNYVYDDYGNTTKYVVSNSTGSIQFYSDTSYNTADTANGISAGAYVTQTTDEHNNKTYYDYDTVSGQLNSVTDSSGNVTRYQYNDDESLSQMTHGGITNNYEYEKNQISSIERIDADNSSQKYNFSYNSYGDMTSTAVGSKTLSSSEYNEDATVSNTIYGNSDKISYTYSSDKELTSQSFNDTEQYSWDYNAAGEVHKYTDKPNGLYSLYDYDTMKRVSMKTIFLSNNTRKSVTSYSYDLKGNVTDITNNAGRYTFSQKYEYTKDNLPTKSQMAASKYYTYSYDTANRLTRKNLHITDDKYVNMDYVYEISPRSGTGSTMFQTHRIEQEFIGYGAYRYKYDKNGNIISIESGSRNSDATACSNYTKMISYYYDNLDELIREDNKNLNQTITYTYDGAGNITSKNIYAYTTGKIAGEPTQSYTYSYNDTEWKDLLTSYNGEEITYDAIGNPTSYLGSNLTWKGHQLSALEKGNTKASYTYDANGLRTTKTVNGTKTYYQYSGDKLIYQETGNKRLYFWYDAFGSLCEVLYDDNGTASAYMVVCNSRGDVERLYDVTGNLAARYVYDSWGNLISVVDRFNKQITNANAIGNVNPIRYRGYYLDSETGYYYLQSRYYNPQLGRFINADLYCDTETGALGTNMFTYCENNPVMREDKDGEFWHLVVGGVGGALIGGIAAAASGEDALGILIGILAGAGSGLLAASGAGVLVQVIGGAGISMASNALTQGKNIAFGKTNEFDFGICSLMVQ